MTAAELRIGNWVTYNPESVDDGTEIIPLNVEEILSGGVRLSDGFDNTYYFDEILPIPLSPELLEAAGFGYYSHKGVVSMEDGGSNEDETTHEWYIQIKRTKLVEAYSVSMVKWGEQEYFTFQLERGFYRQKIKFLHQLQNLYFTLSGEELSIDLNKIYVPSTNK
jgi:hypothetical protein